eukprot:Transcript_21227.p1 GENE.Transcript_21227~~Transcript_21227.p1  ORF type:complete len:331 (-),score=98.73 Transcript_21227:146-1138(-)
MGTLQATAEAVEGLDGLVAALSVPYDGSNADHVAALQRLWQLAWPGVPWEGVVSQRWMQLGFQRDDPTSDLRGAGVAGVHHLNAFIAAYPEEFAAAVGTGPNHCIAIASLNLTLLLRAYLRLHRVNEALQPVAPGGNLRGSDEMRQRFLAWEQVSGDAFELLHGCLLAFMLARWRAMLGKPQTTLLDFPKVLVETRDLMGKTLPRLPTPWASAQAQRALRRATRSALARVPSCVLALWDACRAPSLLLGSLGLCSCCRSRDAPERDAPARDAPPDAPRDAPALPGGGPTVAPPPGDTAGGQTDMVQLPVAVGVQRSAAPPPPPLGTGPAI